MKRSIAAGFAAAVLAVAGFAGTAHATAVKPVCLMPTGFYANADEQTRLPQPTPGGLKFSGNDLIHHVTTGTVEQLSPGGFHAFPAPDQPSFFSVEVGEPVTFAGYATLRWNTTTHVWDMVTGGQIYSNASPAALVDMVTPHKSHHVFSFGVGYTANPPGTVTTTVSSVMFERKTYDLRCCPPKPTHSASPSPSHSASASPSASTTPSHSVPPSHSVSPTTSASSSPSGSASSSATAVSVVTTTTGGMIGGAGVTTTPVADTGALAVTGPDGRLIGGAAGALILIGGAAFVATRRRKARFTA